MATSMTLIASDIHTNNTTSGEVAVPNGTRYVQISMPSVTGINGSALHPQLSVVFDSTSYLYQKFPDLNGNGSFTFNLVSVSDLDTIQVDVIRDDNDDYSYSVEALFLP